MEVQSKSKTKSRGGPGHSEDRQADNTMTAGNAARAEQNLSDAAQPSEDRVSQAGPELQQAAHGEPLEAEEESRIIEPLE